MANIFQNHAEVYDQLPANAKWSSSFGYPGDGGFSEFWRTPDGKRFEISNGRWGDEWTIREVR